MGCELTYSVPHLRFTAISNTGIHTGWGGGAPVALLSTVPQYDSYPMLQERWQGLCLWQMVSALNQLLPEEQLSCKTRSIIESGYKGHHPPAQCRIT